MGVQEASLILMYSGFICHNCYNKWAWSRETLFFVVGFLEEEEGSDNVRLKPVCSATETRYFL